MLATLAARAGFDVDSVADGQMALTMWQARPADIVLLDAQLPGIDGWTVCQKIKSGNNPRPVIILTAFASDDARARTIRAGADQYVTKPFHAATLLELMEHLLSHAG